MKAQELRNKSVSDLRVMLNDLRTRLLQLRIDLSAGKVKNIREIRHIKKDIARILTVLREKDKKL